MGSGTIAAQAATTPRPTARIVYSHVHLQSRWAGLGARGCVNSSGRRIRLLDPKHSRNARNVRYHVQTAVIPVGPQPLASLARPLGPAAGSARPSAGSGLGTTGITVVPSCRVHAGSVSLGLWKREDMLRLKHSR